MEGNIKVKVQTNGMIVIHQGGHSPGGFYSDETPSKDARIHTRLGIGKTQSYATKTRENPN